MFAKYMLASLVIIAGSLTADAGCSDTVSFTVLGQPNIAVGFYDTNANFVEPILLGTATKKTDQNQVSNAELVCENDELKIQFSPRAAPVCPAGQVPCPNTKTCIPADWACDGVDDCGDGSDEAPSRCAPGGAAATATSATPWLTVPVGDGWTFDARATEGELAGYTWRTQAHLIDISYDTKFDGIDVLQGQFTVRAGNSYLINLFGWIKGESTMERTVYPRNMQLKAATGTCPILAKSKADGGSDARTHYRIKDDFVDYGGLAQHTDYAKRMSFMKEYFAEQMDATILPDVQAEMGSKKEEFNNFYFIADGFRADEFSDIAMMEGSVIDPETPGTENAYGYDAIRFKMQCMTPFFLDFDPVEYVILPTQTHTRTPAHPHSRTPHTFAHVYAHIASCSASNEVNRKSLPPSTADTLRSTRPSRSDGTASMRMLSTTPRMTCRTLVARDLSCSGLCTGPSIACGKTINLSTRAMLRWEVRSIRSQPFRFAPSTLRSPCRASPPLRLASSSSGGPVAHQVTTF